ncbi:MAG TPA: PQQ-binding-like beta-propeller repeat protein [Mycobacteriales bacterium]|jgi:outer membrane protein assembly factor BamB|nr:PQQ-binding-like beta-propeller repeat protein [Mycobacteriales bacterium]
MTSTMMRRTHLAMVLLGAVSLVAACSSGKPAVKAATPAASGSWLYPNADLANTRDAAGSTISSSNVAKLAQAWTFNLSGKAASGVQSTGSLAAAPIVANGVVYFQDLDSNVYAVSLATGKLDWEYSVNVPERSGPGPNGVAVVAGTVYGTSPTTAFALSATTGRTTWINRSLLSTGQGTISIQPQVAAGRVYLASGYGAATGGGVLMALNATNGNVLWKFNTVLLPDTGVKTLGIGSGGAWETPLVDSDGSVTFGTGNPYQTPGEAISNPSRLLYTDSDVNLDAATGKLRWYYQGVPDDFMDHDMQTSPMGASIDGSGVVIGSGKLGIVYAMNAQSGRLIWKTPVGEHNGHDNDSLQALEHRSTLKAPFTYLPGAIGGALTNLALAGNTVYVVTCDFPFTFKAMNEVLGIPGSSATGEIEALSLSTGKVEWDTKVAAMPLGAATVSNDLLFTTLVNGDLVAVNRNTGAIVYRAELPATTNSPIAIAGNTVIVPAGAPAVGKTTVGPLGTVSHDPQVVAYTVP